MNDKLWDYITQLDLEFNSVYEYCHLLISTLRRETKGALWVEPSSDTVWTSEKPSKKIYFQTFEIIIPGISSTRNEILRIGQYDDQRTFPVNLICYIDNSVTKNVSKEDLHSAVMEVLSRSIVKRSIEKWYRQSIKAQNKHNIYFRWEDDNC